MPSAAVTKTKRPPGVREGEWHLVLWKGRHVAAQVLDIRESPLTPSKWEVYVHYANVDRRLDEWVGEDRVDPRPLSPDADGQPAPVPAPVQLDVFPQPTAGAAPAAEPPARKRRTPPSPPPVVSQTRSQRQPQPFSSDEGEDSGPSRKRTRLSDGSAAAPVGRKGRLAARTVTEMWTDDEMEPATRPADAQKRKTGRTTGRSKLPLSSGDDEAEAADETESDYAESEASDDAGIASRTRTRVPELPSVHEMVAAAASVINLTRSHRTPRTEVESPPQSRKRGRPRGSRNRPPTPPEEPEAPRRRSSVVEEPRTKVEPAPRVRPLSAAERRRLEERYRPRPVVLQIPRTAAVSIAQKAPPEVRPDEIKEVISGLFSGNVAFDKEREKEREESTKVKTIDVVQFGSYEINTWYFSPFPEDFRNLHKLYVCEYCLKYMKYPDNFLRHSNSCKHHKPPGRQVYHSRSYKIYEVDGKVDKLYCQNLCLLGKLFLDHKTVNYDIDSFYFYVLVEVEERTKRSSVERVLGYYSKEKYSLEGYNLACIIVFPQHQRRGLGRLLIEFSYEITKREGKTGTPERPLSDLGLRGYRAYWETVILDVLRSYDEELRTTPKKKRKDSAPAIQGPLSLRAVSASTGIKHEDLVATLAGMGLLKFWNGPEGVNHNVLITREDVREFLKHKSADKLKRVIDPAGVTWTDPNKEPEVDGDGAKDM